MTYPIIVEGGVLVPSDALEVHAARSSGPGGQNVNKVSSKVELRVDLDRIQGMDNASRERLFHLVAKRMDRSGRLLVTSQRSRDQYRNLEDVRRKIHDWIAQAINPPKKRIKTHPGRASRQRRLEEKQRRAERKQNRRPILRDSGD